MSKIPKSLEEATKIATTVFVIIAVVCTLVMLAGLLFSVVWLASLGLLGFILSGIYWLAWMVGAGLS